MTTWKCGRCEGGNFLKHSRHCPYRRVDDLEAALNEALAYIPLGYTDCAGYKCREPHCQACYGDGATPNDERVERLKAVLDGSS